MLQMRLKVSTIGKRTRAGLSKSIMGMPSCEISQSVSYSYRWHADIKPDNIIIVHGKCKLADPGFAKFVDRVPEEVVRGGTETFGNTDPGPKFHTSASVASYLI